MVPTSLRPYFPDLSIELCAHCTQFDLFVLLGVTYISFPIISKSNENNLNVFAYVHIVFKLFSNSNKITDKI